MSPSKSAMSYRLVGRDEPPDPILPTIIEPLPSPTRHSRRLSLPRSLSKSKCYFIFFLIGLVLLLNHRTLGTWRRDFIYLIRPLWDTPEPPFVHIPHFGPPTTLEGVRDDSAWCRLHGWDLRPLDSATGRARRPTVVDAILLSTELDMLEIRMREALPYVSVFVVLEADRSFSGEEKPLYYQHNRERFEDIVAGTGASVEYHSITTLLPDQPVGSFDNEITMRQAMSRILSELELPAGSLVIQSDVDEIISRQTLELLSTCQGFAETMHLNVKNYRYDFAHPIPDEGYWRPHVYTTQRSGEVVGYSHGRQSDEMLEGAGWHCSFCFATLEEMKAKMRGYSHNDRLRNPSDLLNTEKLRRRVCEGREPFNMWPEAFTFKDLIAQSGSLRKSLSYVDTPVAVQEDSERFGYLLDKGCDRPDH